MSYALELQDVRKNFGKTEIIRGVNLAVKAGERVAVIEAMKMENVLFAIADGVVGKVLATKGESLTVDQPIVEFV